MTLYCHRTRSGWVAGVELWEARVDAVMRRGEWEVEKRAWAGVAILAVGVE